MRGGRQFCSTEQAFQSQPPKALWGFLTLPPKTKQLRTKVTPTPPLSLPLLKTSSRFSAVICKSNPSYYTTKLLGGWYRKSTNQIVRLPVRPVPCIELFKMADAEEIEVCKLSPRNTKQFLSRRRRPPLWTWFGHVKQSGKTRGSCWTWKRRSHYEQQLSFKILSKNINPI